MPEGKQPQIALLVRIKSKLPREELVKRYKERMSNFRALPGLVQKYYVEDPATGDVCGLYLWDSQESLDAYLKSDLRKTIGAAYEAVEPPRAEKFNVIDILRE